MKRSSKSIFPGQISLFDILEIPTPEEITDEGGKAKHSSTFAKKYDGKMMEDWGCTMSDEAKAFYRAFKNYLKKEFPEAELSGFKPNHYDFSGFLTIDGHTIYISHSLNRTGEGATVDFSDRSFMNGVFYRTAKSVKDYTGGTNHFTSINELVKELKAMFEHYEKFAAA